MKKLKKVEVRRCGSSRVGREVGVGKDVIVYLLCLVVCTFLGLYLFFFLVWQSLRVCEEILCLP